MKFKSKKINKITDYFINNQLLLGIFSFLMVLIFWHLLSVFYSSSLIPSPIQVINRMVEIFLSANFYKHLWFTLKRMFLGFFYSFLIGFILSFLIYKNPKQKALLQFLISILNVIPTIVWTFISIIVFGPKEIIVVFVIIMNAGPRFYNYFNSAFNSLNKQFKNVVSVYRVSKYKNIRYVLLPQFFSIILPASRNEISNAWKVGMVAELFGVGNGIGYMIYLSFGYFLIRDVLAWLFCFVLIMLFVEFGFFSLEKNFFSYKDHDENINKKNK